MNELHKTCKMLKYAIKLANRRLALLDRNGTVTLSTGIVVERGDRDNMVGAIRASEVLYKLCKLVINKDNEFLKDYTAFNELIANDTTHTIICEQLTEDDISTINSIHTQYQYNLRYKAGKVKKLG